MNAESAVDQGNAVSGGPARLPAGRRKSPLRKTLEALQPDQVVMVEYSKKSPFSVIIAIKRLQLKKHFVFTELSPGHFKVWIGTTEERSSSIRKKSPRRTAPNGALLITPTDPAARLCAAATPEV